MPTLTLGTTCTSASNTPTIQLRPLCGPASPSSTTTATRIVNRARIETAWTRSPLWARGMAWTRRKGSSWRPRTPPGGRRSWQKFCRLVKNNFLVVLHPSFALLTICLCLNGRALQNALYKYCTLQLTIFLGWIHEISKAHIQYSFFLQYIKNNIVRDTVFFMYGILCFKNKG